MVVDPIGDTYCPVHGFMYCLCRQIAPINTVPVNSTFIYPDNKKLEEQKNAAYKERNQLIALLASLYPSSLERHPEEEEWEDDWRWVVFIDFPDFQASWHIHDSDLPFFDHISRLQGRKWDGHTTELKYKNIRNLARKCQNNQ